MLSRWSGAPGLKCSFCLSLPSTAPGCHMQSEGLKASVVSAVSEGSGAGGFAGRLFLRHLVLQLRTQVWRGRLLWLERGGRVPPEPQTSALRLPSPPGRAQAGTGFAQGLVCGRCLLRARSRLEVVPSRGHTGRPGGSLSWCSVGPDNSRWSRGAKRRPPPVASSPPSSRCI